MIGTLISTIIYILSTIILFGIIPTETLINSPAPFAEAGEVMGGKYMGYFISAGAAISAIGALNGWILITSYMPMTMANDNLFPKAFKKKNKKGFPINDVSRFHLGNGAIVDDIIVNANISEVGFKRSFGVMVNYLYELNSIEKNHEDFINHKKVNISNKLKNFL